MTHFETRNGSRVVITSIQEGDYESRLYVNDGKTATLQYATHRTESGARRWAKKILRQAI